LLDQYDIKDFKTRMKSSNYIIIIPEDLRIKFTEFVYKNHVQALDEEFQGSMLQSDGLFNNDLNSMRPSSDFEYGQIASKRKPNTKKNAEKDKLKKQSFREDTTPQKLRTGRDDNDEASLNISNTSKTHK
jgi:hypothetical protein